MLYCPECGEEVSDGAVICPNCGYPLKPSISLPTKKPEKSISSVGCNKKSNNKSIKIILGLGGIILLLVISYGIYSYLSHQKFLKALIKNSYIGYVYIAEARLKRETCIHKSIKVTWDNMEKFTIKKLPFGTKVKVSKLPYKFAKNASSYLAVIENKRIAGYIYRDRIMEEEDFLKKKKNQNFCDLPGSLDRYYVIVNKANVKKEVSLKNKAFRFLPFGTSVLAHPVSNKWLMVCVDDNEYGDNNTFIGYMHESVLGKFAEFEKKRDMLKKKRLTTDTNLDLSKCYTLYENMVIAMENCASAARSGDYCRAADQIEIALNWGGSALPYCSEDRKEKIRNYMRDLAEVFPIYISKCGH